MSLRRVMRRRTATVVRRGKQIRQTGSHRKDVLTATAIDSQMRATTRPIRNSVTVRLRACSSHMKNSPMLKKMLPRSSSLQRTRSEHPLAWACFGCFGVEPQCSVFSHCFFACGFEDYIDWLIQVLKSIFC